MFNGRQYSIGRSNSKTYDGMEREFYMNSVRHSKEQWELSKLLIFRAFNPSEQFSKLSV